MKSLEGCNSLGTVANQQSCYKDLRDYVDKMNMGHKFRKDAYEAKETCTTKDGKETCVCEKCNAEDVALTKEQWVQAGIVAGLKDIATNTAMAVMIDKDKGVFYQRCEDGPDATRV